VTITLDGLANAEIVVNGHDHNYERFAPQAPDGSADPARGIREFVAGTGGKNLRPMGPPVLNSEVSSSEAFGVLKLTLRANGYDWQFIPQEGKTFTAVNLALAQSHLAESSVLLGDFDLRRPIVHNLFQIDRAPGLSDYLTGQCTFAQALRKIESMNLYLLPAGSPVKNPLELLNMRQAKMLFEELPRSFNWSVFDTPPLLFSADANLLSTMADGTILVVKIGSTTFDNVTRAMQSLCENNVLGIVANGARASELYSKYTYYYSKAE
jgi:receptor protein-tyrosine kinase